MLFLFIPGLAFCQLSISPTHGNNPNFLYVSGPVLYVEGGIHLQKNHANEQVASLYLRKEGQLIQGDEGTSGNSGNGEISIFQEATSNAYDYNYWASPVGNEAPGNGLFGIGMLHAPEDQIISKRALNTGQLNGLASPFTISNRWIHTYAGTGYSDWNFIGHDTAIPAGYGFSMKGVSGTDLTQVDDRPNNPGAAQRYDFRGKPNSGTIQIPIYPDTFVLTGNPYPSALDLSLFLLENSGSGTVSGDCHPTITRKNIISGIAYFWDSIENGDSHYLTDYVGGYGAFSPVDPCTEGIYTRPVFKKVHSQEEKGKGEHYARRFSPVAQGFMVKGVTAGMLEFQNRHRVFVKEGEHSAFKSREAAKESAFSGISAPVPLSILRLEATIDDHYSREFTLAFWPGGTAGTDPGMDAPAFHLAPTDIGWLQSDRNYSIDVRPFDPSEKIPLFLKVEQGTTNLNLRLAAIENLEIEKIYILDEETGGYHALHEKNFELSLEPGIYHGRFKISFTGEAEAEIILNNEEDGRFDIFQNNRMGELEILNPGPAKITGIAVYDLQGKMVFHRNRFEDPASIQVITRNWSSGIYVVKINSNMRSTSTRKIAVLN